jgi:hypothetical protein
MREYTEEGSGTFTDLLALTCKLQIRFYFFLIPKVGKDSGSAFLYLYLQEDLSAKMYNVWEHSHIPEGALHGWLCGSLECHINSVEKGLRRDPDLSSIWPCHFLVVASLEVTCPPWAQLSLLQRRKLALLVLKSFILCRLYYFLIGQIIFHLWMAIDSHRWVVRAWFEENSDGYSCSY